VLKEFLQLNQYVIHGVYKFHHKIYWHCHNERWLWYLLLIC